MIVLTLTLYPSGLAGRLSRFLLEVSPGVFVGSPNKRVLDHILQIVEEYREDSSGVLIRTDPRTPQGFRLRNVGKPTGYRVENFEGLDLITRKRSVLYHEKPVLKDQGILGLFE